MDTKANQVLLRSVEIARRRVAGDKWPAITAWLQSEGIQVTDSQVRVYWCRHHKDTPPAVIVAEAEAAAWAERCSALTKLVDDLRQRLSAAEAARGSAEAENADLRRRLQQAEFSPPPDGRTSNKTVEAPAENDCRLGKPKEETPPSQPRSLSGFQSRTYLGVVPDRSEADSPLEHHTNRVDEPGSRNADAVTAPAKAQEPRRELTGFKKRPSSMGLVPRKSD